MYQFWGGDTDYIVDKIIAAHQRSVCKVFVPKASLSRAVTGTIRVIKKCRMQQE
jgi:hypothetical protein